MARNGSISQSEAKELVAVKEKPQSSTTWILFDSDGQCSIVEMDKHGIMDLAQIHYRDLRILDPLLSYPSAILGREKAILLNLEHIKAIITAEEVLLRYQMDENVVPVVEELKRKLTPMSTNHQHKRDGKKYHDNQHENEDCEDDSPLEFQVLEVALEAICSFLAARTTELEMETYFSLDELTNKISSLNLDRVRKLKSTTTSLTLKVLKILSMLPPISDASPDRSAIKPSSFAEFW
ncbi:magnesium transporter MRS2-2-like [Gastrolobium bilobum]|uniref:magnesium transporter MRS2-2-like n=1 Tax=Gastrolobium bilobum TaxID=150636 RepID=UPI002AB1A088|nr:magnesium transporter MRS2-2-like [Gastrolobium bilobum]